MCLNAADVNPLCDECFAKEREGSIDDEIDLCDECREMLKRYCACCLTLYGSRDEGGFADGDLCMNCRDN